jgi:hypothetical protein
LAAQAGMRFRKRAPEEDFVGGASLHHCRDTSAGFNGNPINTLLLVAQLRLLEARETAKCFPLFRASPDGTDGSSPRKCAGRDVQDRCADGTGLVLVLTELRPAIFEYVMSAAALAIGSAIK